MGHIRKRMENIINGGNAPPDVTGRPESDVNFYDYDGTIVESYTKAEFEQLNKMPDNPSHTGLTAQGWNWSFEDAQEYVRAYGKLHIGQMYTTFDGKTRIYIDLFEGALSPTLSLGLNGTCIIDWGDNNTDTMEGTSTSTLTSKTHTYAVAGSYVISLEVLGTAWIRGEINKGSFLLTKELSQREANNSLYINRVNKVELGASIYLNTYAFYNYKNLKSIVIPPGISDLYSSSLR